MGIVIVDTRGGADFSSLNAAYAVGFRGALKAVYHHAPGDPMPEDFKEMPVPVECHDYTVARPQVATAMGGRLVVMPQGGAALMPRGR
jgi:hypothetical protein